MKPKDSNLVAVAAGNAALFVGFHGLTKQLVSVLAGLVGNDPI